MVRFGEYFDVSHPAVLKWESAGDDAPAIKWSLERDLRLFIMDRLGEDSTNLGRLYRDLKSKASQPSSKELYLDELTGISDVVFNNGLLAFTSKSQKVISPESKSDEVYPAFNDGLFTGESVGNTITKANELIVEWN